MKVSIITVCYNSSATLEQTILSVSKQNYEDIEYIVIDGKSVDGTVEIIKKYSQKIDIWISEKDQGLYDAINKGILLSSGQLIGILNSDDIFFSENTISDVVSFHKLNNIEASVGNVKQIISNGNVLRDYTSYNWNPEKLVFGFMPPHPSVFLNRELFDKFGYYHLSFKIAADYELITRFFLKNRITWKYSGITTTNMLVGGISSSGISSYRLITKEIMSALTMNGVKFSALKINLRFCWKMLEFLNLFISIKKMEN